MPMQTIRLLLAALFSAFLTTMPATAQLSVLSGAAAQSEAAAEPEAGEGATMSAEDSAKALIEVLQDEAARARLIEELGRIAAGEPTTDGAAAAPAGDVPEAPTSVAGELGIYTQELARDAMAFGQRIWSGFSSLWRVLDGTAEVDWDRLQTQVISVGVLVLLTLLVLYGTRWIAQWPLSALDRAATGRKLLYRVGMVAGDVVIQVICVALAWLAAVAYLLTTAEGGRIGLIESYFLNAFLVIEAVKIGLRAVFEPRRPALRLLPISDGTAAYWSFWLARATGFLGYGVMLVFPMVNAAISYQVGLGVRLVIVLTALIVMITLVWRNRVAVRTGLSSAALLMRGGALSAAVALFARIWHWLAIGYLLLAFVIWVTRPFDAISYVAVATLQTLLVMFVGGGLMSVISRTITGGIKLPAEVKQSLPLLEQRLNLLIPTFLKVIRLVVFILVVLGIFQAWDLLDFGALMESDFVGRALVALVIVVVAMVIWIAATSWIEYRLNPATGRVSTARARTLFALFRNAFTIILVVIAAMLALSELGVDIAPLIAGAGVLGLAVGFGSQKLVQDIINGAFIQFENAMNEGDVVTVAGISGVVERLTIRSVGLRDLNGIFHLIPFSSVDSVSNFMRGFAFHVQEMGVAYRENTTEVKRLMQVAFERLMETEHAANVLEPLDMHGVTGFADNAVMIRVRIKTLPGQQWSVGRAYDEILKFVFDEHNVEIPFPQRTIWFGEGKHGEAPALNLRRSEDAGGDGRAHDAPAPPSAETPRPAPTGKADPRRTLDVPESPDGEQR